MFFSKWLKNIGKNNVFDKNIRKNNQKTAKKQSKKQSNVFLDLGLSVADPIEFSDLRWNFSDLRRTSQIYVGILRFTLEFSDLR